VNGARKVHLITGGKYHDFDLARLTLLTLIAEDDRIRGARAEDFSGLGRLSGADGVILYTCDLMPTDDQAADLERFVGAGGRMLALHATSAPIDFTDGPLIEDR
jgi:hypothetical protein